MSSLKNFVINTQPQNEKWEEFVKSHPNGNIFQTSLMYNVYSTTPNNNAGVVALEDTTGAIHAILVYAIISEPGIKSFFTKRSIITGGPLVKNNNPELAALLLKNYLKIIKKQNVIYTEVRNLFDVKELNTTFTSSGFIYEDHLTIHMDLTKSKEDLEKALHRGRASNIKRAIKKEVTTREITSIEDIKKGYLLIEDTYKRINLPAPNLNLFLQSAELLKPYIKFYAAFLNENIIGCRVYLLYNNAMYDWYAAVDREYSSYCPSDLLPWNAMMWGKENNMKLYDFAGAGKPNKEYSVRDYKLKFGGTLLNFGRYKIIHKPLLYKIGVIGLKFYKYVQ